MSHYTIDEQPASFIITRDDGRSRTTVGVELDLNVYEWTFKPIAVECLSSHENYEIPLYGLGSIISGLAYIFRENYVRIPLEEIVHNPAPFAPRAFDFRKWILGKLKRNISKIVRDQWRRILASGIDETALAVHRALFAAGGVSAHLPRDHELWNYPYTVRDVLASRGAAYVVGLMIANGGWTRVNGALPLHHWRGYLSHDLTPYRALNRTLDAWPAAMRYGDALALRHIRLERPITERLPLSLLSRYADTVYGWRRLDSPAQQHIIHLLQHTSVDQVKTVLRLKAFDAGVKYSWNAQMIDSAARYIFDYTRDIPDRIPDHIDLVGLMVRAVDYHREVERGAAARRQMAADRLRRFQSQDAEVAVALPPAPLPEIDGITFLATLGAVRAEGATMMHCVAGYDQRAYEGECYLFHVEHNGEHATVQVDPDGKVAQSYGPKNKINSAAVWGAEQLRGWGKSLRTASEKEIGS